MSTEQRIERKNERTKKEKQGKNAKGKAEGMKNEETMKGKVVPVL
jgi:hypothetical protein